MSLSKLRELVIDREAWCTTVHGITKSQIQLSDWTELMPLWYRASLIAQLVKNPPAMQETLGYSWVRKICWRRDKLPTPVFLDFPGGSDGKESVCNVGDLGLIPELGRSHEGGHGNPLQYSCLENLHGQKSLAGYSPWSHNESNTTEHSHAT